MKDLRYHPILDYGIANCYEGLRDYDKAIYYLEKYIRNHPKHKMSPKPADPQQQQQQQMMMTIMPVMFFFIFYGMPSGLVLYFVASMIFTIAEQYIIRRSLAAEDAAAAGAGGGGGAGGVSATGAGRDTSGQRGPELADGQKLSKRKKKGRRK